MLLSATSRDDKLWEEARWIALAREFRQQGLTPVFPAGNAAERQRAARLAEASSAIAAPPLDLHQLAALLGHARLTVGVDTGLVHLATALGTPTIALYVATNPALTGVFGPGFARNLGGVGQMPEVAQVLNLARQIPAP